VSCFGGSGCLSRRCYEYRWIWRTSWPYPCPQRREQLAVGHADEPVLQVRANLAECQVSEVGLGEANASWQHQPDASHSNCSLATSSTR
jgi:hypothetical protein